MRPKRRNRQIVGSLGHIQQRQDPQQLRNVVGLDALLGTVAVQPLQSLVAEADDHTLSVSCSATRYQPYPARARINHAGSGKVVRGLQPEAIVRAQA